MKKLLIFPLFLAILSLPVIAQKGFVPKSHEFKGSIKTQNGEAIAGANLCFKKDARTFTFVTDINGEFKAALSAGNYEMTVNDGLSKNFRAFIKIQDKGANPNNAVFAVKTNKNPRGLAENEICPKPKSLPKAVYPAAARAGDITGEVIVKVKIDSNGGVISAKVIKGHPLLNRSARIAAKTAKFEAVLNEKDSEFYLTYVFLEPQKNDKKNVTKYKSVFRVETIGGIVILDACDDC